MMTQEVTSAVAKYALSSTYADIPERVRSEAVRSLLNWAGCTLGGCTHPAVETALALANEFSGARQASVLGRAERLDALNAALINCMSSAVYTYDDTHLKSIIHPGGPVLSAIMALAERRKVSGPELLHALILGIEISCRLGSALTQPPARYNLSLFMTGITSGVGVAVAAGKLLHLTGEQIVAAIGIAATQAAGLREMHGTMCSSFVPGNAARSGLLAALLAERDFESAPRSLEGPKGFGNVFCDSPNWQPLAEGLGEQYEMLFNSYKPYPCGVAIHPTIDACLDLAVQFRPEPSEIVRCDLKVHPVALKMTGRRAPASELEAQVSVYHWAAAVLVHRVAGLREAGEECIRDPSVVALRDKVHVTADPDLAPNQAHVEIALQGGRKLTNHVERCRGSHDRPMSDAELQAKFTAQAEPRLGTGRTAALMDLCLSAEELADVSLIATSASSPEDQELRLSCH